MRWRPLETLVAAVALSLLAQYLAGFALYVSGGGRALALVVTAASAAALVACRGDVVALWRHRATRHAALAQGALLAWVFVHLVLVRDYSGGVWYGDWFEHYERARFFTDRLPLGTTFLEGLYGIGARPPMMSLLTAHLMSQTTVSFEGFQWITAILNSLVFLPCALLARELFPRSRNAIWRVAGLFALNPAFLHNTTWTWTKLLAAFYVVAALAFYLAARRRDDPGRRVAAFVCLSSALLVHYSAAPFVLFLAGHYLLDVFRRRRRAWLELAAVTGTSAAILATWLGWAILHLGWSQTFGATTTAQEFRKQSLGDSVTTVASNLWSTLVPFPLRGGYGAEPVIAELAQQHSPVGSGWVYVRDSWFSLYQMSLPFLFGLGGAVAVVWLVARFLVLPAGAGGQPGLLRRFWLCFLIAVVPLGVAFVGGRYFLGVAHICLQPLLVTGLTFVGAGASWMPRWLRWVLFLGLVVDASLGIALHFHVEHLVLRTTAVTDGGRVLGYVFHPPLNALALSDHLRKTNAGLQFLGDHLTRGSKMVEVGTWLLTAATWFATLLLFRRSPYVAAPAGRTSESRR